MSEERRSGTRMVYAMALVIGVSLPAHGKAEPAINPKDIKVTVKDNQFFLQEEKLTFPGELEPVAKLLGKPSRVGKTVFQYQVWDELGLLPKNWSSESDSCRLGSRLPREGKSWPSTGRPLRWTRWSKPSSGTWPRA